MNFDISQILDPWEYQPGQVAVRKFRTKEGVEKIQLRVDLGLLQMNGVGRPDGKRPFGHESLFDYYRTRVAKHAQENGPADDGVKLDAEACSRMHQEIVQYHHRYICLYQLGDYDAVIRDTTRNEEAIHFVQQNAQTEELSLPLLLFKPQLMMMRIRARAATALTRKQFDQALELVQAGIDEIREFTLEHNRAEIPDQGGEIRSLEAWMEEIRTQRPLSPREKLQHALDEAVATEDYEKAAKVRDALRNLKV